MRTINGILLTPSQLEEWQEMFAECDGDQQLADELWRHGHRHDGQQWIPIRHFANMEVDNDFVSEIEQQNVQSSPNDTRWNTLPLGLDQIEADASDRYRENSNRPLLKADQIRCCVRDCTSWLPLFHRRGDAGLSSCPEHGIRMSTSPTYVYRLRSRNFMVRADWPRRLKKVETWRLGNENSEDAVSWNVFVSLAELGALGPLFQLLTGVKPIAEAELYVWGNGLYGASHLSERL